MYVKIQTHRKRSKYLERPKWEPFCRAPALAFLSYGFRLLREARLLLQYADHMDVKALSMIIKQNKETGPFPHAAGRGRFHDNRDRADEEVQRTQKNGQERDALCKTIA